MVAPRSFFGPRTPWEDLKVQSMFDDVHRAQGLEPEQRIFRTLQASHARDTIFSRTFRFPGISKGAPRTVSIDVVTGDVLRESD